MRNILWTICGFCAAGVGLLIWAPGRPQPLEVLAHRLEDAWAEHYIA